jgi:hypothetical protein
MSVIKITENIESIDTEFNICYNFVHTVNTLEIKLPYIASSSDSPNVESIVFELNTGSTPNISIIDSVSGRPVHLCEGFEIEANGWYEINCLWDGAYWKVGMLKFDVLVK